VKAKRLIFVGLDGMVPEMLLKFVEEGIMPNMGALMRRGVFARMWPVPQTATATNWATLSTGCWAGTHGVDSFASHIPGSRFDEFLAYEFLPTRPISAHEKNNLTQVEFFWDAAEREGRRVILVNWPYSWPPTVRRGVVVNDSGPSSYLGEFYPEIFFRTRPRGEENETPLRLVPAKGWKSLPASKKEPLEGAFSVTGEETSSSEERKDGLQTKRVIYRVLLAALSGSRYDTLIISRTKDASRALARLREGTWTDWLEEDLQVVRKTKSRGAIYALVPRIMDFRGKFRFKLTKLSPEGEVELFRTPVYNTFGWAYPEEVADILIEAYFKQHSSDMAAGRLKGVRDRDFYEAANPISYLKENFLLKDRLNAEGLTFTAEVLARRYDWDIMMVQIHCPDTLNHYELGQVSEGTAGYSEEAAKAAWEKFRTDYLLLDNFVGSLLRFKDDSTAFVVVSDHGGIAVNAQVWLEKFFMDAGLLTMEKRADGYYYYVPKKSKVFVSGAPMNYYIWYNIKGRDPEGTVEPSEIPALESKVLEVLHSIRDPMTGQSPFSAVLRREDANCFGLWGEKIGDIVFFYREGYMQPEFTNWGPISEREYRDFIKTGFGPAAYTFPGCYSQHAGYLPSCTYKGFSVAGVFLASGPAFKKGVRLEKPFWTVDVVPTLSHILGMKPPRDSEGGIFQGLLERPED